MKFWFLPCSALLCLLCSAALLLSGCAHSPTPTSTPTPTPTPSPSPTPAGSGVSDFFFGFDINKLSTPWPAPNYVQFGNYRTLGSDITWHVVNTASGTYDWSHLDQWIAAAKTGGQDILFDVFSTPTWASSNPTDVCGGGVDTNGGGCDTPNDLNADGTGTDQHLKDFVTALITHEGAGAIKYLEVWNEPNVTTEYRGTVAQLISMARDIRQTAQAIDPNIKIIGPAVSGAQTGAIDNWTKPFLTGGGTQYIDYVAFHGYCVNLSGSTPEPECISSYVANIKAESSADADGKPVWNTEGSWGQGNAAYYNSNCAAAQAFVPRYYLLQIAGGVSRLDWYGWDFSNSGEFIASGSLTCGGNAYKVMYSWVIGNTPSGPCTSNGSIYSCSFTGLSGSAEAIWDASGTCSGSTCPQTGTQTVAASFTSYEDITGATHAITGNSVPVSAIPVWVH